METITLVLVCTTAIKTSEIICRKRGKTRKEPGHLENWEATLELRAWSWPTHLLCLVHSGPTYWTCWNSHHSAPSLQETEHSYVLHPPHLDTAQIPTYPCHPSAVSLPSASVTQPPNFCITFPSLSTQHPHACLLEKEDIHLSHTEQQKQHTSMKSAWTSSEALPPPQHTRHHPIWTSITLPSANLWVQSSSSGRLKSLLATLRKPSGHLRPC